MKYKTSFFNKYIVLEDLKRYWGASALYFLAIFFTGPMGIMLRISNPRNNVTNTIKYFLDVKYDGIQVFYSIMFSIILAMIIFRYLHQNKSATVMHSMPITRKELFNSHNIAAFILSLLPVLINAVILLIIMFIYKDGSALYDKIFTVSKVMIWMGKTILLNTITYLIATLTAVITGISLIHGALSFIFIFLPIGLSALILINFDQLIYGFVSNQTFIEKIALRAVPVTAILSNEPMKGLVGWYLFLGIILYLSAYYFYKKRHLESASDPIAFDILKPIFKYGVTFCSMVLGGAYFEAIGQERVWIYVGYIIGAYLGYLISEMLIKKSIWVFKNIKGLLVYGVVIIILFAGINFDIIGYERRIPNFEKIDSAYYGYHLYSYWKGEENPLKNPENIKNIQRLHQELINNKKEFKEIDNNISSQTIAISYKLKNGRNISREYRVPIEFIEKNRYIGRIYESEEYKINYYDIFDLDKSKLKYVEMYPRDISKTDRTVKIVDEEEISELVDIIKKDILEETYEEYRNDSIPWAEIVFQFDVDNDVNNIEDWEYDRAIKDSMHISWQKSYDNLSKWLKEKGYYEKVRIMPEEIDYIIVEEIDSNMYQDEVYKTIDAEDLKTSKDRIEIRDKEKIEILLKKYESRWPYNKKYVIGFYLSDGESFLGWLSDENAPAFIKEHFE